MKTASAIAILMTASFTAGAASAAEPFYKLICRGKLAHRVEAVQTNKGAQELARFERAELLISFARNTRDAGWDGARLQPGTCAWADRAWRPTESYESILTRIESSNNRNPAPHYALLQCLHDESCTFELGANHSNARVLWAHGFDVTVRYPKFEQPGMTLRIIRLPPRK